ncbi:alpha/beta fold hydrolase, partial [Methylobacterium trifolii]
MARKPHSILPLLTGRGAKALGKGLGKGLGLAALGTVGGWMAYSRLGIDRRMFLPPALPGRRETLDTVEAGGVSFYGSAEVDGPPLLLVHSINAAANAYEVRPLYTHYRTRRPVYALDLPGFGFSERARRLYTPRTMVEAIHAVAGEVRRRHGGVRLD